MIVRVCMPRTTAPRHDPSDLIDPEGRSLFDELRWHRATTASLSRES
jgi:hypothetical protein